MKVVLVCIARDEDDYIEEWANYNFKLGFDNIVIYQDRWECKLNDPRIIKLNMRYTDQGRQVGSYIDFIKNISDSFDYAAFFDIDEFLVLKKHKNIKSFIKDYPECQSIGINWVNFGDNGLEKVINDEYSVLKRFTKRKKSISEGVKQILKLDKKIHMNVHNPHCEWCDTEKNLHDGVSNPTGTDEIAQLNHYYCKTIQEFTEKKMKNRCDDVPLGAWNFYHNNFNEVEDFWAYNFLYGEKN